MIYDISTLYRFSLLVVGCPVTAEELIKKSASREQSLEQLWRELSQCSYLKGSAYQLALRQCGASERLCGLLCELSWEERALFLLKLLFQAPLSDICVISNLSQEAAVRTLREISKKCVPIEHAVGI